MALGLLFWMALMITSQIGSWLYVVKSSSQDSRALYRAVWQLSLFYVAWALYKKMFLGDDHDLGYISFGLLALAAYCERKWFVLAANVLLLANFLLAVVIIISFDAKTLAQMVKHDDTLLGVAWALIFEAYIVSSLVLWSYVLYLFYRLPPQTPYPTLPATRSSS